MKMARNTIGALASAAILAITSNAAHAQSNTKSLPTSLWDGLTFGSVTQMGEYTHYDTDTVSGLSVTGVHSFAGPPKEYGCNCGWFNWTGTISPTGTNSPNGPIATISGSGTINNLGIRPFSLTSGGIYLSGNNWVLYWGGNDPKFGAIGGVATAPVDFSRVVQGAVTATPTGPVSATGQQSIIQIGFKPNYGLTLQQAAAIGGFDTSRGTDGFEWIQTVVSDPTHLGSVFGRGDTTVQ
jgi:hypothetical protein